MIDFYYEIVLSIVNMRRWIKKKIIKQKKTKKNKEKRIKFSEIDVVLLKGDIKKTNKRIKFLNNRER